MSTNAGPRAESSKSVEAPRVFGHRELPHVCVAMKAHDRRVRTSEKTSQRRSVQARLTNRKYMKASPRSRRSTRVMRWPRPSGSGRIWPRADCTVVRTTQRVASTSRLPNRLPCRAQPCRLRPEFWRFCLRPCSGCPGGPSRAQKARQACRRRAKLWGSRSPSFFVDLSARTREPKPPGLPRLQQSSVYGIVMQSDRRAEADTLPVGSFHFDVQIANLVIVAPQRRHS